MRTNITFYLLLGKDQKGYVDAYAEQKLNLFTIYQL